MQVGDVIWLDGKKVEVTYVDGRNFSYCPYVEEEPKEKKPKKKGNKE